MKLTLKYTGKTSGGASKYEIQPTISTPATPAIPASGTGANKIEAVPAVPASDNLAEILGSLTDGLVVSEYIESEDGTFRTITTRTHCYLTPKVGDVKELNIITKDINGVNNTYFIGNDKEKQDEFNMKNNTKRDLKPIKVLTSELETADISMDEYINLSKALLEISKLKTQNKILEKQLITE
jgi:hypothetical protein